MYNSLIIHREPERGIVWQTVTLIKTLS